MSEYISGSMMRGIKSLACGAPIATCYRLLELYPFQLDPHPFIFAGVFTYGYWVSRTNNYDFLDATDLGSIFIGLAASYMSVLYAMDQISKLL